MNPHLYSANNFGFHHEDDLLKRHTAHAKGTDSHTLYSDEAVRLWEMLTQNFWIRLTENRVPCHTDWEQAFNSQDYTMIELVVIGANVQLIPSYKRDQFERELHLATIATVESRLEGLESHMAAMECRKHLDDFGISSQTTASLEFGE